MKTAAAALEQPVEQLLGANWVLAAGAALGAWCPEIIPVTAHSSVESLAECLGIHWGEAGEKVGDF